jgi:hypothetical protein
MMEELFMAWLEADNAVHAIKERIKAQETELAKANTEATEAMIKVRDLMNHDGVLEDTINGKFIDYKLYYTTPRESVKVDAEAVPDKFCKIERKPKLKEIGDLIRESEAPPNWARFELSEPKLTYKAITRK